MSPMINHEFHGYAQKLNLDPRVTDHVLVRRLHYQFGSHFHPFVSELISRLTEGSVDKLLSSDIALADPASSSDPPEPADYRLYKKYFDQTYGPTKVVEEPYPEKSLEFSAGSAYAIYNWELFFHVPLIVATHLSKNRHFADAQRWFHYIFDPTDSSDYSTPERFWKVRAFRTTERKRIDTILTNLATGEDQELLEETLSSIEAWKLEPFQPHAIAKFRFTSYMYKTVMAYLDNLIEWGDALFREDTVESINEATQIYIIAAQILGPRPQEVPKKGVVRPRTYEEIRDDLSEVGSVMVDLETEIPFDTFGAPGDAKEASRYDSINSLGQTLYFCIPKNEHFLGYWNVVADRLFKIRNSLNIRGQFRQLALFEPPIDPAMLSKMGASGLDVKETLRGANQSQPAVRFSFLAAKANELCQEVKSLGNSLLSAMEKKDNAALEVLRAQHQKVVLKLAETVREKQIDEAKRTRQGLEESIKNAFERYEYYSRLLGVDEVIMPNFDSLDSEELEQTMPALRDVEVNIADGVLANAAGFLAGGRNLSKHEVREVLLLEAGQALVDYAGILNLASAVAHVTPQGYVHAAPAGVGGSTSHGGESIGNSLGAVADALHSVAGRVNFEAQRAARIQSFYEREREWEFQSNLAAGEIASLKRQWEGARIREEIAEQELENHRRQIQQAEEIEQFLTDERKGRKTNEEFYAWMKREVKGLFDQCYQFAYDVARKAERALQHELGDSELSFLQFDYDAGREGLLAGEKLWLDLKRLELAYQEERQQEFELTKHISLKRLSPMALLQLRTTGECEVSLPEWLFDLDCPGHYKRRIKQVSLTIPSVTGPYTGVNCKLSLLRSSVRNSPGLLGQQNEIYVREEGTDHRFQDQYGRVQSIVTSHGDRDGGLFDNSRFDERYQPFELSGAYSTWRLELPTEFRQFDYDTISDVLIHVQYTAREGGRPLQQAAIANLESLLESAADSPLFHLIDFRRDFPSEWHLFDSEDQNLNFTLTEEHLPYLAQFAGVNIQTATWVWSKNGGVESKVVSSNVEVGEEFTEQPPDSSDGYTEGDLFMLLGYTLDITGS